ncbi:MAG: preprotein translocase subunit SecE [Candidatus Aminicenantia bacterium]
MANEKVGIVKRILNYLGEVRTELKKATWPSRKETIGTTIVVVILVIFFGFFLFFFDAIFSYVIAKIKVLIG